MSADWDQLAMCAWEGRDAVAVVKYTKKKKSTDWLKPTLADVRTKLRHYLLKAQSYACAYCRRMISIELGHHEIDHILAKGLAGYARFTYERINLVATCKRCNRNKGDRDLLVAPLATTGAYPQHVDKYLWVHPYIHKFSTHIKIREGMLFEVAGSAKQRARGKAVIDACGLDTLSVVEHRRVGEMARYTSNTIDAIITTVGNYRQLSERALVALLRRNRVDLRKLQRQTLERLVSAVRRHDFNEFSSELKSAGLQ